MGVLDETVKVISDMWEALKSKRRHKKHKQLQTVEIKIKMDCEGCEKKVKDAVKGMKGVTEVVVEPKKNKLTVTGYVEPEKVLKRVMRKTGKRAELWPYVPYTLVDHPYVPGIYDKKAPPGYVRDAAVVNPAASELACARPEEERLVSAFSDDNPNACALM
ncbi:hypothetical protein Taro_023085 [Colocasia esculenta]|uniref:HMA domain-containing protein n=1 Tax=Colocasia esculenta TaxID=4460 RepID=A0A843V393_COLES|nr:hypothetical protein [Colocasia esculenta]